MGLIDLPLVPERQDGWSDLDLLRAMAARGPLVRDRLGILHCFTQADLDAVFADGATRQLETETLRLQGITEGPAWDFMAHSLLFSNGAVHRARRTPLARAFAWKLMEALCPAIREEAGALVAACRGREVDFVAEVAGPLPARIIARVLGVDPADGPRFSGMVYSAVRVMSVRSAGTMAEASADMGRLAAYVDALIAARRADPREDFLTAFLARVGYGPLSEAEVRAQVVSLIIAGADTTRLALSMSVARLIETGNWAALREDPAGRAAGAAAEGLRFDPVVGALARVVAAPFELHGVTLRPGTIVAPSLPMVLRDPAVHAEPDRFDIFRSDHPRLHPVFGAGPHRCLGEALARAELEETLTVLAETCPAPVLTGPPPRLRGLAAVREITPMPVRLA